MSFLFFHNDIATRYFRINVASHQNKKGLAMSFNSSSSIVSLLSIKFFHNDIATRYFRINVASHQNKKGLAMSFNSSSSIVSLLSIKSCVGYSTNLNKSHRNETISALFFVNNSTRPCVEILRDII